MTINKTDLYPGGIFNLNRTDSSIYPCVSSAIVVNVPDTWPKATSPARSTYIVFPGYSPASNYLTMEFLGPAGGFGYPP